MMSTAKLQGKIKEYSTGKKSGTLVSGNHVYHFYSSDMLYEIEINELRKDLAVSFLPVKGDQKLYAQAVELADEVSTLKFEVPDKFLHTRELSFDNWLNLETSRDTYTAYSNDAAEDALNRLVAMAKAVKANALLDLKKLRTPAGGRYGYRARFAVVGNPLSNGPYSKLDLTGLNRRLNRSKGGNGWLIGIGVTIFLILLIGGMLLLLLR